MEECFYKYVVPVFDRIHTCGQGCFVGDYFLTSGHIIDKETKFLFWNKERLTLDPKEALSVQIISEGKDENSQNDFALFRFNGINSPLMLSGCIPQVGTTLNCITWVNDNDTSKVDGFLKRITCKGEVIRNYHHFFSCQMNRKLYKGSSGSPLILNNMVWGILSGLDNGNGKDELFFQSSAYIHFHSHSF